MGVLRWCGVAGVAGMLVVASCSGGGGRGGGTSDGNDRSSERRPRSTAPSNDTANTATASIRIAGDPGVAGAVTDATVTCRFPDVRGSRIAVLAGAGSSTLSLRIAVSADRVYVHVDAGSGAAFEE